MWHTLLHIYGPIAIHGYGFMIAIGLLIFLHLMQKDRRFHALKLAPHITSIVLVGVIAGILGGRILFFIIHPEFYDNFFSFLTFFNGGLSILGAIIALLVTLPLYLAHLGIAIIPFLDLVALYAPLLQSISRLGCFLAGCCYGIPTTMRWGITYTAADSSAPLHACLHPTQLYSSMGLFIIFALLYFVLQYRFQKNGQLLCLYLLLVGFERFFVEFWRGDRVSDSLFSLNHYIAASMIIGACIGLFMIHIKQAPKR